MLRNRIVPDGRDGHGQGQSVEGGAPELTTPTTIPEDNSTQHSEQVKKPKWGSTRDLNRFLRRKKLIKILSVFASFGWIFYIIGFVWLFIFPFKFNHKNSYIDENALLPGQASKVFGYGVNDVIQSFRRELKQSIIKNGNESVVENARHLEQQFVDQFLQSGIQTYTPYHHQRNHRPRGFNVYSLFRSPRSDGTEVIAFSAPWVCKNGNVNVDGMAYLMAIAASVKRFSFWAKDFLFVIPDSLEGMKHFVEAYHQNAQDEVPLKFHGGGVQQAINLEFCGEDAYSAVGFMFEGLNGQLSNLDLLFTISKISRMEGIPTTLSSPANSKKEFKTYYYGMSDWEYYLQGFTNVFRQMKQQVGLSFGYASTKKFEGAVGEHAVFTKYGVDAITLTGVIGTGSSYIFNGHRVINLIEETLRSLNNLLEYLHHSMFFYILPSVNTFIPISHYAPVLIVIVWPLFMDALLYWFSEPGSKDKKKKDKKSDNSDSKAVFLADKVSEKETIYYLTEKQENEEHVRRTTSRPVWVPFFCIGGVYLVTLACFLVLIFGGVRHVIGNDERFVYFVLALFTCLQFVLPFLLVRLATSTRALLDVEQKDMFHVKRVVVAKRKEDKRGKEEQSQGDDEEDDVDIVGEVDYQPISSSNEEGVESWKILKSITSLWIGLVLVALNVLNFSLACFFGLVLVPFMKLFAARSSSIGRGRVTSMVKYVFMNALFSPIGVYTVVFLVSYFIVPRLPVLINSLITMTNLDVPALSSQWAAAAASATPGDHLAILSDMNASILEAWDTYLVFGNWLLLLMVFLYWPAVVLGACVVVV